ncbi:MAG: cytochrome ubiquinol oxidase subunit I [Candidatus Marinimicrobia bacterium]|nr:cytochrome ubiquinol oxidase subunit I [Candidatus Neomarinimicrobiota bacterium]
MTEFNLALVDWSRAQFALTALYHWIFVPLTLGLSFILAFIHTIYYKTGDVKWKNMTKFWMKLFGINFAIGVATGIILEFQFGTNWSNYSWFMGDIFGAPLAIEAILAFFLESTFIAVMFFGWERVSKKFHMMSSWLVAVGSNLSALWILIANAWMQNPVGMKFNPDTVRNEMANFFEVALSSTAVHKFLHTVSQAYVIGALFVVAISAWFLLRKRHIDFAKKSILIASIFGLLSIGFVGLTGDGSAYDVAQTQPMKLAAMEGLFEGETNADLVAAGIIIGKDSERKVVGIKIPGMLSWLAYRDVNAFVPGVNDIVNGNVAQGIPSTEVRMQKGEIAINALADYGIAKNENNGELAAEKLVEFESNYEHFGYGYFENKEEVIPNVPIVFYSFHIMVILGSFFALLFAWLLYASLKDKLENNRLLLRISVWSILLGYIATMLGWVVAEVGRQPWTIQDILPVTMATSNLGVGSVQTTFFIFLALFTVLLIAEIKIMFTQIKAGPAEGGKNV